MGYIRNTAALGLSIMFGIASASLHAQETTTYAQNLSAIPHPVEIKMVVDVSGKVTVTEINGAAPSKADNTNLIKFLGQLEQQNKAVIDIVPTDTLTIVSYIGSSCHAVVSGGTTYWRCH